MILCYESLPSSAVVLRWLVTKMFIPKHFINGNWFYCNSYHKLRGACKNKRNFNFDFQLNFLNLFQICVDISLGKLNSKMVTIFQI